ncbi:unnamed protein product [Rotaria sp. Silwood2]|nr:unnamed protein product [Rotaria sp. Silwood2]
MNNIRNEVDGYQSLISATIDSDSTSTDSGEYIDIKAFNNPSNSRARLFLTLTTAGALEEYETLKSSSIERQSSSQRLPPQQSNSLVANNACDY